MKQKLKKIEENITKTKKEISSIKAMRPGSLSLQARQSKKAYGQYWQLSYTFKGKGHTEYIIDECVKEVEKEVEAYRRFRQLVDELIELSIEASKLRVTIKKEEVKHG